MGKRGEETDLPIPILDILFMFTSRLKMVNGLGGTWYGTGTARHEHVSVRHEARHGTQVGCAGPRILGTRALKHGTIRDGSKHGTRKST